MSPRTTYLSLYLSGPLGSYIVCCLESYIGVSFLLPLMNNFNKTETSIITAQAMLPEGLPFLLRLNNNLTTTSIDRTFIVKNVFVFSLVYKETSLFPASNETTLLIHKHKFTTNHFKTHRHKICKNGSKSNSARIMAVFILKTSKNLTKSLLMSSYSKKVKKGHGTKHIIKHRKRYINS